MFVFLLMRCIMIKVDLITGFLGSGKTTFIKKYVRYLLKQGMRVGIIENDLGAINVDMILLQDLDCDRLVREMVVCNEDADCHRRRYKTKLISLAMRGIDRVVVEPSGIYNPDEFFDVLYESPLDSWYEAGSVISVVDARLPDGFTRSEDYFLMSEVACSGKALLSHLDVAPERAAERAEAHIAKAMKEFRCVRSLDGLFVRKPMGDLTDEDFGIFMNAGWYGADYERLSPTENTFRSIFFFDVPDTREELAAAVRKCFSDSSLGHVFRIKGFIEEGGTWYELNAAGPDFEFRKMDTPAQKVIIVIGDGLDRSAIDRAFGRKSGTAADGAA